MGDLNVGSGAAASFSGAAKVWGGGRVMVAKGGSLTLGTTLDDGLLDATGGGITVIGGFSGPGSVAVGKGASFTLNAARTKVGNLVRITTALGTYSLKGGSGADLFEVAARGLAATDTVAGGAGADTLAFTTAGVIRAAVFTHVSGVDAVHLADGSNTLTLSEAVVQRSDADALSVTGGSGADRLNASAVTGGTLVFDGEGGADSVRGGRADNVYDFDDLPGSLAVTNGFSGGAAAHGTLAFGGALNDQDLWFERQGKALVIDVIGTSETVVLNGWYTANRSDRVAEIGAGGLEVDSGVARLVSAMASFSAHNPGFNPTALGPSCLTTPPCRRS